MNNQDQPATRGSVQPVSSVCCPDWEPQTKILDAPIILQSVRSGGAYQYPGIPFRYCPWCGKQRSPNAKATNPDPTKP
jgi:hypothetical protein